MWAAMVAVWLTAQTAPATAPRVEMELGTSERFSPLDSQQWYRLFTELGVATLRIRAATPDDQPAVEVAGAPRRRVYRVRGQLTDRGDVVLPGGRFSAGDRAGLAAWLKRLKAEGPPPPDGKRPPFGISPAELARVRAALAAPNRESTRGLPRGDAIARVDAQLAAIPLALEKRVAAVVPREGAGDEVVDELKGLSLGTSLAALLRPAGLALQPRRTAQETLELVIVAGDPEIECWPIGWQCDEPKKALPNLHSQLNVELANITLDKALAAVAARLQAPLLLDHNGLAAIEVDPAAVQVEQPAKRLTYSLLLRKLLVPARLKFEVRQDDAGKGFLWVTTARPE